MSNRVPHNPQAEDALLATFLIDPFALEGLGESELQIQDFYNRPQQALFGAMMALKRRRQDVSERSLIEAELVQRGVFEQVGGEYLDGLYQCSPSMDPAGLINTILAASVLREAIRRANAVAEKAMTWDGETDPFSLVNSGAESFEQLGRRRRVDKTARIGEVAQAVIARMDAVAAGEVSAGFDTWIDDLSAMLGPVEEQELIVIGARPAQGKTQFGLQWCRYLAEKQGIPVSVASLEMDKQILTRRLLSQMTGIPASRIRSARLNSGEREMLDWAVLQMDKWPLYIDSEISKDVDAILAWMRYTLREYGCRVFLVDYLQIMGSGDEELSQNRSVEVARLASRLREFAFSNHVNVIVLSQVKREVEYRKDKLPLMADLMESGGIEAAAKKILTIMRPAYYEEKLKCSVEEVQIRIAKNTEGETGTVKIGWKAAFGEFVPTAINYAVDGSTGF